MSAESIRIIQYLGSKIKLLPKIDQYFYKEFERGDTIVDLFAGTGVVSNYFKKDFNIICNDIQEYSYLMNLVLMNNDIYTVIREYSIEDIYQSEEFKENYKELSRIFKKPLEEENRILKEKDFEKLAKLSESNIFYDNTNYKSEPYLEGIFNNSLYLFTEENLAKYKKDNKKFPYMLFSTYYLNGYFSIQQCIEIDSLRYAIDNLSDNEYSKDGVKQFYLSCLLHAISEVVSSVGKQFAQPLKLTTSNKIKKFSVNRCYQDKTKSIKNYMINMHNILMDNFVKTNKCTNVYNLEYNVLLDKMIELNKDIDGFYIDPPYTIDHYSRFYHIPETLIKYDYPDLEYKKYKGQQLLMKGRYRDDRFQSNFCIPSKVYTEFENMISKTRKFNGKIFLSYSDYDDKKNTRKRVISKEELIELLNKYYTNVEVINLDHEYRKFNNHYNNKEVKKDSELLIICK